MVNGYKIESVNPPLNSTPSGLVETPGNMWRVYEQEGNILGQVRDTEWHGIFPLAQAVAESEGIHLLLSPRRLYGETLETLRVEDLAVATEFMLSFLSRDNVVSGINVSGDPPGRRSQSQRWGNLHVHAIGLPRNMVPLEKMPTVNSEPMKKQISLFLERVFQQGLDIEGLTSLSAKKAGEMIGNFARISRGILFEVSKDITPVGLATAFKELDRRYRALHERVFGAFTSNYYDSAFGGWRDPLRVREGGPSLESIEGFPEETRRYFRTVHRFLKPDEWATGVNREDGVFRAPSYSAVIMHAENPSMVLALCPSIQRRCGIIEAFGIVADKKTVAGASFDARRERAQIVFNEVAGILI